MKNLKIIVINLILFVMLFFIADFITSLYYYQYEWFYKAHKGLKLIEYVKNADAIYYGFTYPQLDKKTIVSDNYVTGQKMPDWFEFRPVENKNADKSLLLFGCSFAQGWQLRNDETFSYFLGKLLPDYRIYNRAHSAWTTNQMLYQLENKDFSGCKNVKYVVYVFIPEHISRNYNSHLSSSIPYYKLNGTNLTYQKYSAKYVRTPLILCIKDYIRYVNKKNNKVNKNVLNLTVAVIKKSKSLTQDKFGKDTKFIVLRYDQGEKEPYDKILDELKNDGIEVICIKDLSNTNYFTSAYRYSEFDEHPNAKFWQEITPLFLKYLQDKGYLKD